MLLNPVFICAVATMFVVSGSVTMVPQLFMGMLKDVDVVRLPDCRYLNER